MAKSADSDIVKSIEHCFLKGFYGKKITLPCSDYRNNHLVTIDRRIAPAVQDYGATAFRFDTICVDITIHLTHPLKTEFRVCQKKWLARLLEALRLSRTGNIRTGDRQFDNLFDVSGKNARDIAAALNPTLRKAMVSFVSRHPMIYTRVGTIEMNQESITYSEGPYDNDLTHDTVLDAEQVIDALLNIAKSAETHFSLGGA
jgi:hypothetical protein